jgi:hypothetical protein
MKFEIGAEIEGANDWHETRKNLGVQRVTGGGVQVPIPAFLVLI